VIERIKNMSLDENLAPYQSTKKTRPYHNGPLKWIIKTLESVHPYEVRKIGTNIFSRKYGGDVDNSNLGDLDDIDVSYDCELNLSTNFVPTSFEQDTSHDEWKEAMKKEYDSLIKSGTWKLVDPPFGTKTIDSK
jgi:hypothetical protein